MGSVLVLLGLAGLVVALVGVVRGQVQWARLRSRRRAATALAASVVVLGVGSTLSSPDRGTAARSVAGTAASLSPAMSVSSSASTPPAVTATSAVSGAVPPPPSATTHFRRVTGSATPSHQPSPSANLKVSPRTATPPATSAASPARVRVVAGVVLPDPRRTPGSRFAGATTAQICRVGYSAGVRSVSEATRRAVYASYGVAWTSRGGYEVDHLIALELGGDNSIANLWPEPQNTDSRAGYATKDGVENHLNALVCAGKVPLATAQNAIAANWYTAYERYRGISATAPTHTRAPPPTVAPDQPQPSTPSATRTRRSSSPSPGPPGRATALCNDGTYSYSAHHQGTCSHHHGVKIFYK